MLIFRYVYFSHQVKNFTHWIKISELALNYFYPLHIVIRSPKSLYVPI